MGFYTVTPCRVVDTRSPAPGSPLAGGVTRTFPILGNCGIPLTARVISFNITVTAASSNGNVRLFPGGTPAPTTSTVNFTAGVTRANNGIVALGTDGDVGRSPRPGGDRAPHHRRQRVYGVARDMRKPFAAVPRFLGPLLLVALAVPSVQALERPSRADIARYRLDGSLRARRERAYELGNHKVKPGLAADAAYRLQLELWRQGQLGERPTPPSGWKGMPTKGNVKILALLIAFSDYAPTNTAASIDGEALRRRHPGDCPVREPAQLLPARLLQPARDRRQRRSAGTPPPTRAAA